MLGLCLFVVGLFALLNLMWLFAHVLRYLGWRGYDKEFRTEYRFREGCREGFDSWPWAIPLWAVKLLRNIEASKEVK